MKKIAGVAASVAILVGGAVLGVAAPASAWGTGTVSTAGCTGSANTFSVANDGYNRAVAGTYESGNFCPSGRQILGAGIRYVSNYNGGGTAGGSWVTGYSSVQTPSWWNSSSLYAGGRHQFGSGYGNS